MRRTLIVSLSIFSLIGCGGRDQGGTGGGNGGSNGGGSNGGGSNGGGSNGGGSGTGGGSHTGGGSSGGGSATGGSGGSGACPTITVTDATTNLANFSGQCVTFSGAVVVSASTPFMSTASNCVGDAMTETFYVQDPGGSEGVGIYRSCRDNVTALPNVGDIVDVSGLLRKFDSSLQLSSSFSASNMVAETLVVTGIGGQAGSGAYPPAGTPIEIAAADQAGYAHTAAGGDPHSDQLGKALHFANVTVVNRYPVGFVSTSKDGGSNTEGFELSNGVWVDDSQIYYDCIRMQFPSDAGISLPNGIKGMWDRYNDFYGETRDPDSGIYTPSPTVPVLVPMTCADIQ